MTCESCTAAEANPETGRTNAFCTSCQARALANSPQAFDAIAGKPEALRQKIVDIWKEEGYKAGREAVWAWVEKFKKIRGKT